MFRSFSSAQYTGSRLIGSAVAFLLLCGAALLGGSERPKIANAGLLYSGAQTPLVKVFAYPNDCQRSSETRRRNPGEGDNQPDQSLALDNHPQSSLDSGLHSGAVRPRALPLASLRHHPQAARAPPAV